MNWKTAPTRTAVEEVDVSQAMQEYQAGSLLIDVREPHEYGAGHAPGAELVPLGELARRLGEFNSGTEILFICRSGNRSGVAAEIAGRAGLRAKNVRGGMIAWADLGLPVER